MKRIIYIVFAVFISCRPGPIPSSYRPEIPVLPPLWEEILGEPHWRIEWVTGDGNWAFWEGKEGGLPRLSLGEEWTSPVLAWPFWPEKGVVPGIMCPAGALFPWDAKGERLSLSWKNGIDAFFWKELAENGSAEVEKGTPRYPWYFDWPRFRELMEEGDIPEEVRLDLWNADWDYIAKKTVESGWDRRRIKPETKNKVAVPCPAGGKPQFPLLWISSSPFVDPLVSSPGADTLFMAGETPETWFSVLGLLRVQKETWVFIPWTCD